MGELRPIWQNRIFHAVGWTPWLVSWVMGSVVLTVRCPFPVDPRDVIIQSGYHLLYEAGSEASISLPEGTVASRSPSGWTYEAPEHEPVLRLVSEWLEKMESDLDSL